MKRFILFAVLIVACLSATAVIGWALRNGSSNSTRPSDNLVTRDINPGHFNEIRAYRINVVYTQSENFSATLEAPDNIIDLIEISNQNGKLAIAEDKDKNLPRHNLKATLTLSSPYVEEITAGVSAKVSMPEPYVSDSKLEVSATTGSRIRIASAKVAEFSAETSTGSNIEADSIMAVREADIETSTGSSLEISKLCAAELELKSSTGSRAEIGGGAISVMKAEANTGASAYIMATVDNASTKATTGARIKCPNANLSKVKSTTGGSVDQ